MTYEELTRAAAELDARNRDNPNRLSSEDRYRRDPVFRGLVDLLHSQVHAMPDVTPSELREALLLACCIHETRCVVPMVFVEAKRKL